MTTNTTHTDLLVTNLSQALEWLAIAASDPDIGIDIETDAREFPHGQVAGFSMFVPSQRTSFYVPLRHVKEDGSLQPYNVAWEDILPAFQAVIDSADLRFHAGGNDQLFLVRDGLRFRSNKDSYLLANVMQSQQVSLKTLALEYRIASFSEVITYTRLIADCRGISPSELERLEKLADSGDETAKDTFSFARIDVQAYPRALKYACDDPRFTFHLWDALFAQYSTDIGDSDMALELHRYQCDTDALLAESSAAGMRIDPSVLDGFINSFEADVARAEEGLRRDIRSALNWSESLPTPPPTLPSLLEI